MGSMGPAKTNGDAAAQKKRKRDKNDDRKTQKKLKHQGISDSEEFGTKELFENGQLQLRGDQWLDQLPSSRNKAPVWKLSSPMGGRMLDIDPVFSHDER